MGCKHHEPAKLVPLDIVLAAQRVDHDWVEQLAPRWGFWIAADLDFAGVIDGRALEADLRHVACVLVHIAGYSIQKPGASCCREHVNDLCRELDADKIEMVCLLGLSAASYVRCFSDSGMCAAAIVCDAALVDAVPLTGVAAIKQVHPGSQKVLVAAWGEAT